jgi:hypothetical protein
MYGDTNDQVSDIASIIEIKGIGHRHLRFNDESPPWMHKDHHGYQDLIDDHLSEKSLDNVWNIPEP